MSARSMQFHFDVEAMVKVGVIGATGAVGQRFVQLLAEHPWFELVALAASGRSAGKRYGDVANWRLGTPIPENVRDFEVLPTDPKQVDVDVVFSALPASIAREVEPRFAEAGFVVASNASSYRMESDVPLMIPEVNPDHLGLIKIQRDARNWDGCIITNPNCTTIVMALTLRPLMRFDIERVYVATMQAVSGAGYEGVASMTILDNVIPYIKDEEEKVETEAQKILGKFDGSKVKNADFSVSASCHRVPVMDGHTEAIWVMMRDNPTIEEVRNAFRTFRCDEVKGLPTAPEKPIIVHDADDRPQPRVDRNAGRGMSVSVGRVREHAGGVKYIAMGHNTIRGAAGASVLNAELLVKKKMI
ncbi:MAG: aspartate-semialdehyde dehydrogenase [Methanosarcinales archaeon Met12]|nr:MAG: aspartate-semialdehyde dehydrogenase [Methanosarcinales archaeon Met12]